MSLSLLRVFSRAMQENSQSQEFRYFMDANQFSRILIFFGNSRYFVAEYPNTEQKSSKKLKFAELPSDGSVPTKSFTVKGCWVSHQQVSFLTAKYDASLFDDFNFKQLDQTTPFEITQTVDNFKVHERLKVS